MSKSVSPDHDQRLKVLLKEFFLCFFPAWAARFEFGAVDWLDKELFLAPPQGEKRQLDLVARLRWKAGVPPPRPDAADRVALVHVEVETRPSAAALEARWDDACAHYDAYLASVMDRLPADLRPVEDTYRLHDAVVRGTGRRGRVFVLVLQPADPPQPLLTFTSELVGEPVRGQRRQGFRLVSSVSRTGLLAGSKLSSRIRSELRSRPVTVAKSPLRALNSSTWKLSSILGRKLLIRRTLRVPPSVAV
ncbi:MAG: hypothetical protein L0Z62_17460, partial [Gemmataceae bacterium]|nr:hypothetical protein [Gemmataceae bacterium]